MDVKTIKGFESICQSGLKTGIGTEFKGVLLKDILAKAKIKQTGHKDRNFTIVAAASDSYKTTFSWAELFNNLTGDNTFIVFEENGQPIKEKGEMVVICTNYIKTGIRHVYWLKCIEVFKVD